MKPLDSNARRLVGLLSQLITITERNGGQWSIQLKGFRTRLERGDRGAVDDILEMYGGMGSFTDFILGGTDGEQLELLSTDLLKLAQSLQENGWKHR